MYWYEEDVRALERDRIRPAIGTAPPAFYGSSSIRLWDSLAEDVGPGIVNLGFGGSTLEACDYFFQRIVPPVRPPSLLLYAGDNDLGDGRSPDQVFGWFRSLSDKVEAALGGIPLGFLSIKPSPARRSILDRIMHTNSLVRAYTGTRPSLYYVDIVPAMLDAAGNPDPALFAADGLHLSREGYRVWGRALAPYHDKIFTK